MAQPTVSSVRLMSDQFSGMSDEKLQLFIDDAYLEITTEYKVNEVHHERLTRYLAAHLAYLDIKEVSKEAVGALSREYQKRAGNDNTGILSTPFGQEYKRILDRLLKWDRIKLAVL